MRFRLLTVLLAGLCLGLAACGGDDGGEEGGGDRAGTATQEERGEEGGVDAGDAGEPLAFEQVEDFTIETLGAEPAVKEECKELDWIRTEREKEEKLPRFQGVKSFEALTCEGVPYLLFYVFPDAATAERSLGLSQLPYLVAGGTTAVQPLIAVDERAAVRYLEALREECGCGEIVRP
jgi:hypothetical protein